MMGLVKVAISLRRPLAVLALLALALPAAAQEASTPVTSITQSALVRYTVPLSLAGFSMRRPTPAPENTPGPRWGSPGFPVPPAFYPANVPDQANGPFRFGPHIIPGPDLVPTSIRPPGT
jgi:hypothetical protein